jgi:hypothetical protein
MKKTRVSTISELSIDVVEFLFFEWLRRRGVFSAYRLNCGFNEKRKKAFRTGLRYRIQDVLHSPFLGVGDLISRSFLFTSTPEGYAFWSEESIAWRRFCTNFKNNFK